MGSVMTGIWRNFQWVADGYRRISGNVRARANCTAKLREARRWDSGDDVPIPADPL